MSSLSWSFSSLANYEAELFLVVNQHDGRRIVNQVLVGLGGEVPKDFGVIASDYYFWFYSPVFTVLKVILSTYDHATY